MDPEEEPENIIKTTIKVFVTPHDAENLSMVAKGQGISRADLCGDVLSKYLAGTLTSTAQSTQVPNEGLSKALEESQKGRESLQQQVYFLEKSLSDKSQDLEWTRGQLVETQRNLTAALAKIPLLPERTGGFWSRLFGSKPK